jgi:PKD repeat protein
MRLSTTLLATTLALLSQAQELPCGTDEIHRIGSPLARQADFPARVAQTTAELEQFTREFTGADDRGGSSYIIPVVFHIIHNDGPENITDAQVQDAIRILNDDFNRLNQDWDNVRPAFQGIVADIGIEFRLATRDPNGQCTNGITRTRSALTTNGAEEMKALISWPRNKYMQVWVAASADGAAGYTYTPGVAAWIPQEDGIVMQHIYVGSIGTGAAARSRSLTHEVGHWLNLSHTWGSSNTPGLDSNCDMDDGVSDTPNTRGWTTCTLNGASCGSTLDNVENFMEYSYCSKMFTEGQKTRMIAALNSTTAQRNQLSQTSNLVNTGVNGNATLCAARFMSNIGEICAGQSVTFSDQSYHNVTSRSWSFPGGEPSTSTEASPVITYPNSGLYPVTLTVSDGSSSLSTSEVNYITVLADPGTTTPLHEGFETANIPEDVGWTALNVNDDNGFTVTTAAAYSGSKSIRLLNTSSMAGRTDQLVSPTINMADATDITVSFRYAYARRSSTSGDQLRLFVSNDCGRTWSMRAQLFGTSDLNTGGIQTGNFVPNGPEQWGYREVTTINSSYHVSDMRIRFDLVSDGGNNLYLDDINLNGMPVGLEEVAVDAQELVRVVPNPTQGNSEVILTLAKADDTVVELQDMLGRSLARLHAGRLGAGEHRIQLPLEHAAAGAYFVRVTQTHGTRTVRVAKQ